MGDGISRDPLEEQGGEGLYVFAANATTCYIDLFGLCSAHSFELSIPRIQLPKIPLGAFAQVDGSVTIDVTLSGSNCGGKLEGTVSGEGSFEASVTVGKRVGFVAGGIRLDGMIGIQAGAEATVRFQGGYRQQCSDKYGELFFSGGFTASPFIRGGAFLEYRYPRGWPRRLKGPPWGEAEMFGVMLEGRGTLEGTVEVACGGPKCVVSATRETSAYVDFKWSLGWLSGYHRIWDYSGGKSQKEKLLEFDNPLRRN